MGISLKLLMNACGTKLCPFLEPLKMTTCGKIVPVVALLASSRQGIPSSKGK